jgi:hypothetical protein
MARTIHIHIQRKQSGAGESSGVFPAYPGESQQRRCVRSLDSGKSFASRSGTEQSCALHPEAADDCNLLKLQLMPNCGSGCICAGQPAFCPALARNSPSFVMLTDEPAFASLDHCCPGLLKRQVTMCVTKADSFILRAHERRSKNRPQNAARAVFCGGVKVVHRRIFVS